LQQGSVFGEAFHQDLARAVEGGLGVGHARIVAVGGGERFAQVLGGFGFRVQFRVLQQAVGQRRQAGFDGDLGLGAAFLLVRQI
jgi:hypothetical protein